MDEIEAIFVFLPDFIPLTLPELTSILNLIIIFSLGFVFILHIYVHLKVCIAWFAYFQTFYKGYCTYCNLLIFLYLSVSQGLSLSYLCVPVDWQFSGPQ